MADPIPEDFVAPLHRALVEPILLAGAPRALAIVNGLEKAKSLEADDIAAALRTEKVETPFGSISFDEHGDPVGIGFNMFTVKNGQYVIVE